MHDHISNIELLWRNTVIQATFRRRSELPFLPDAASFLLNRMAEFCRSDYEPSEINILRTEGLSQGSGLVEIEITLDDDTCSWFHDIRVGGEGMSDRHKWLDMFEDVRAVVFCVALSDYDLLWSDRFGNLSNEMVQIRDLFESTL
uniref:Uncharacterized protein n=1 Tax=Physcomitrium patens TaxID=3218 RepID=A0A2K1L0Q0_PHYPA|nr:hypothetical protein PHYPA_002400 [Physcomitrium patens]